MAATLRGLQWAAEHPEEAVAIYVARHPELKKDLLLAQWKAAVPVAGDGRGAPGRLAGRGDLAGAERLDAELGPAAARTCRWRTS